MRSPVTASRWSWTASVLCRGRRPARRRRADRPGRRGGRRGRRRAEADRRSGRPPRPGRLRRGHGGGGANALVDIPRRKAISRAHTATHAGPQGGPGGARRDRDAGRLGRTRRAGSGSTSTPSPRCRSRCCAMSRPGQRGAPRGPRGQRRGDVPGRNGREPARWRSSAKYGDRVRSSRSGTGPASCAAAPTQHRPARCRHRLLGEASIGSGSAGSEALVGSDAYGFLAREQAIVGQLTEVLKVRSEELPSASSACSASSGRPNARSPRCVSSGLSPPGEARRQRRRHRRGRRRHPRRRRQDHSDDLRTLVLDVQAGSVPSVERRRDDDGQRGQTGRRRRDERGRPRPRGSRPAPSSGSLRPPSAAEAAAAGRPRPGRRNRPLGHRGQPRRCPRRGRPPGRLTVTGSPGVWVGVDVGSVRVRCRSRGPCGHPRRHPLRTLAVTTDDALVADPRRRPRRGGCGRGRRRYAAPALRSRGVGCRRTGPFVAGALAQARPGGVFLVDEP